MTNSSMINCVASTLVGFLSFLFFGTFVYAVSTPSKSIAVCSEATGAITQLRIQGLYGDSQRATANVSDSKLSTQLAVTFGQVFVDNDLPDPSCLHATLADGTPVPLQVNSKAAYSDGSVRHAILTAIIPTVAQGKTTVLTLARGAQSAAGPGSVAAGESSDAKAGLTDLLAQGFSAEVKIVVDGVTFTASADNLLRTTKPIVWLAGPLVNEWQVSAPFRTAQGLAHPNLSARFAIRAYTGMKLASVDVVVENDWAFSPMPQNYVYDVQISVARTPVYSKSAIKHFHHARWRKVFWWGARPEINIQHDTAYLISTKAVPNYDQSVRVSPLAIRSMLSRFSGPAAEPMGNGLAVQYMPTTGGRLDIGLLPGWAVMYLLSMDEAAKRVTLGTADQSGSWSMHYRDQKSGRPVTLLDYPYLTLVAGPGDTFNPKTKKSEAFPVCGGDCVTPFKADDAHEPAMSYLPYLVTGDYYYLEELQFWTMFDLFQSNPGYRATDKGLFHQTQVRAQAWSLRDLSYAAFITPDVDPFKKQFEKFMADNLDWYNGTYQRTGSQVNIFGALVDRNAREYLNQTGIAPWQDDFFTSAVGRAVELGFVKAKPLLAWKAQFPIKRMTDPGYCWIAAGVYAFKVSDQSDGPVYRDMAKAYLGSNPKEMTDLACASQMMASQLKLQVGEMIGHSNEPEGFPSNMQPALALSVYSGVAGAAEAWKLFMSRSVKPDFSSAPQFAIIPRNPD